MKNFNMVLPNYLREILEIFAKNNKEVYLVGGCVRNTLLNLPIKDYDLVTPLRIEELKELFKDYPFINRNGEKHNTLTIHYKNELIEITSYRTLDTEEYTLVNDLLHRDITLNAIAYSIDGELIDPYNGIEDIKNKIIRGTKSTLDRIKEDPLRILRMLRFASLYSFKIVDEDRNIILPNGYLLKDVSVERIFSELQQILLGDNVKEILLEYRDVFKVIIPELESLFDFNQNSKYHLHDIYTHTVNVVSYTQKDITTRLAALLHDIGKPKCYSTEVKDGMLIGHFYGHYDVGSKMSNEILTRFKASNKLIDDINYLIYYHDLEIGCNKRSVKKFLLKTPDNSLELFQKLVDLKIADFKDHVNLEEVNYSKIIEYAKEIIDSKDCLKITDLDIDGYQIMSLGYQNKEIGDVLKILLQAVIDEKVDNKKDELMRYIKEKIKI